MDSTGWPGTRSSSKEPPGIDLLASLPPGERLRALDSTDRGLSADEARRRLRRLGRNELPPPRRRRPVFAFLANFTHTLALLLWFAAGLAFAASLPELGGAIVAVIGVNGVFAFVQEFRAERVVASLMRRVAVGTRVVRDGDEQWMQAGDLVPGDVIRLTAGDIVPADCVLLAADNLSLDLSMLTGESAPVERTPDVTVVEAGRLEEFVADVACAAPSGAAVISGGGDAVVYATGAVSALGRIAAMVATVEQRESVLERQVGELSVVTAALAIIAGAVTLTVAAVSTDIVFVAALTFATGVLVALVPEGLLPTLSVSLAIGAERMAKRGAAVRRLSAVEAIGSVTVICTDKTGTLTQNSLSVLGFVGIDGEGVPPPLALEVAVLCNDARPADGGWIGDALDVALIDWSESLGVAPRRLKDARPRESDIPFEARRRFMSVTCRVDGTLVEFIKGAPEEVTRLVGASMPRSVESLISLATARGERVLMLAARSAAWTRLLGVVRLYDPPRAGVVEAIAACRRASIRVVMLTGDHPGTAKALALAVGVGSETTSVLSGEDVDALSDIALLRRLRDDVVFARISPRQKLRITELLRRSGEIVVVTGDGINDAPALRAADVGVAMGRRGTEVAKQAADIVLADDNFATIVAAIEEGRSIKTNIRRFVSYVFTSNVAELAPFLLYIFLPIPLPLAVVQVLAIDLGTDLLPAMALGAEPPSPRSMDAPPEPPAKPLLTRSLAVRTFLFFGLIESVLGIVGYLAYHWHAGWRPLDSFDAFDGIEPEARALTFLCVVGSQIGCLFAQRDGNLLRRLSLRSNPLVIAGLIFELALGLVLVMTPGVNRIFSMATVNLLWLLAVPLSAACFVLVDHVLRTLMTFIQARRRSRSPQNTT